MNIEGKLQTINNSTQNTNIEGKLQTINNSTQNTNIEGKLHCYYLFVVFPLY
jgi:hypothetical protein